MPGDMLLFLNIHIQDIIAGFAGGICISFANLETGPYKIIRNIVVGGLLANYLGDWLAGVLQMPVGRADFIIGLSGTWFCQFLSRKFPEIVRRIVK